jgi:sortase A
VTAHGAADVVRGGLRLVGEVLITAGLVVLLFAAYLLWGTNLKTAAAQDDLRDELRRQWAAAPAAVSTRPRDALPVDSAAPDRTAPQPADEPVAAEPVAAAPEPLPGDAVALVRFPMLGDDAGHVVVEGVTTAALRRGPGHYPGTARPGEVGNVVLSGHRTTYGAPFADIGELLEGDAVVLETGDAVHTYRVTGLQIVPPTAIEVTYPVPGQAGAEPTERLLTLTTCHPRYSARQRLVVTAELVETQPRATTVGPA